MKKPKKQSPDIGGIAPTFEGVSFSSLTDNSYIVYNGTKNKRKAMIQQRRKAIRNQRKKI